MYHYGISQRCIAGNENPAAHNRAEIIALFRTKEEARQHMEHLVVQKIAAKNGVDFVNTKPINLKETQKWQNPESNDGGHNEVTSELIEKLNALEKPKTCALHKFVVDVKRDHGMSSPIWKDMPNHGYFVTRDSREMDKFTICEKVDNSGYLVSGYTVKKICSMEIICVSGNDLEKYLFPNIDEEVVEDYHEEQYYPHTPAEIENHRLFVESIKDTPEFTALRANINNKHDDVDMEENHYV